MTKRSKYGARKTQRFGIWFDSGLEADRYLVLRDDLEHGRISNLRLQVAYPLQINGLLIATYIADFVYTRTGAEVVEDVKGVVTPAFRLKYKLMRALLGIRILVTDTPAGRVKRFRA